MKMSDIGNILIYNSSNYRERALLKFLKNDGLYIFGAGKGCEEVLSILSKTNVSIKGILVSNGHKTADLLAEFPVFELDNKTLCNEDKVVVSVYSYEDCKEILSVLINSKVSITNIFFWNREIGEKIKNEYRKNQLYNNENYFDDFVDLDQIGQKNNTDKSRVFHDYLNKYELFLSKFKDKKVVVMELGVYKGGSINTWAEFFNNAKIIGVDIDETCKKYETEKITIEIGDLSDWDCLTKLSKYEPTIVIDDASHIWSHQIMALCNILPSVKKGGVYIVEDLETSFIKDNFYYGDIEMSAYDFCEACAKYVTNGKSEFTNINNKMDDFQSLIFEVCEEVTMVSFIEGSCIICK